MMGRNVCRSAALSLAVLVGMGASVFAQFDLDRDPINYETTPVRDRVTLLQRQLAAGEVSLDYDRSLGYLPALLKLLDVPASSQMLVFSKTSAQLHKISPQRPRAIYFNDDTYVGYVQGGDFLEISSVDPGQGAVFHTLTQDPDEPIQFVRDRGQCLICHASSRTEDVPGHLIRSVFTDSRGQPLLGSGTFVTDDTSPFEERWGGWYVTGTHGAMRHMGNVFAEQKSHPETLDRERGANVTDLAAFVDTKPYLGSHSDLVALMVLEHQARMHNLLTRANYEARSALHYDRMMNEALGREADFQSETTERRIAAAGEALLKAMLFSGEYQLTDPVAGSSKFAADFVRRGVRDSRGRSLRDLDLQARLFRYPCSFLVDSPAFDELPAPMREYVANRLGQILAGADRSGDFAHLTPTDRQAIREILRETNSDLVTQSRR